MSFNASTYLLDRHLGNGDGDRLALTGTRGDLTYAALHDRVRRTAGGLRRAGLRPEQRLVMVMADSPELVRAPGRVGRGAAAGRALPPLDRPLRRRRHRRHRHDRDAAHLPLQPPRRRPARHHRRPGARLRPADPARRREPGGRGGAGHAVRPGRLGATGYWCRYAASRQVFQGEWLRTGDTYRRDADGFYHCLGRTDDVLKVSGMWVAPAEVENRLLAHPCVAEAVVVAAPDADELDKPVAFVIRGGDVTEAELVAFCRDGMESYKRPRRVVFVAEFPTTATGKVRRVEFRAAAEGVLKG